MIVVMDILVKSANYQNGINDLTNCPLSCRTKPSISFLHTLFRLISSTYLLYYTTHIIIVNVLFTALILFLVRIWICHKNTKRYKCVRFCKYFDSTIYTRLLNCAWFCMNLASVQKCTM